MLLSMLTMAVPRLLSSKQAKSMIGYLSNSWASC